MLLLVQRDRFQCLSKEVERCPIKVLVERRQECRLIRRPFCSRSERWSAMQPFAQQLTVEASQLGARVEMIQTELQAEIARRTAVQQHKSPSSEGLSNISVTGFGERPPVTQQAFGVGGAPVPPPGNGINQVGGPAYPPVPPMPGHQSPPRPPPAQSAQSSNERSSDGRDIFSRADKWLLAMPLPDFSKWKASRQEEILQFSDYIAQLRSWVALGSERFGCLCE